MFVHPNVRRKVNSPHDFRGPGRPKYVVVDRKGPRLSLVLILRLPCLPSPRRLVVSGSCLAQANRRESEWLPQLKAVMEARIFHPSSEPILGFTGSGWIVELEKKKTQCKRLLPGLAFTPRPCPEHLQFSSGLIVLLHVRLRDPEGLSTLPKDTQPTCGISMKGIPVLLAEESLALGLPT